MADQPDAGTAASDSIAEDEFDRSIDRSESLMGSPRSWPPLLRAVAGVRAVDLEAMAFAPGAPAQYKILALVFLLAIKDRASEVLFEPVEAGEGGEGEPMNRMLYRVDGELLELVPPPDHLAAPLRRAVERAAGFQTARRRAANLLRRLAGRLDGQPAGWESGRLRLRAASLVLDATLWVHPCGRGRRLSVHLPEITAAVSDAVWQQFRAHFDALGGHPGATSPGTPAGGA